MVKARLTLSRPPLTLSFTTLNRLLVPKMIEMKLVEGPFKHFDGYWLFQEQESTCEVQLKLHFEFSSKIMSYTLTPLFHSIGSQLVSSFLTRASHIYAPEKNV
jgi:ribosome-associated toxin RatA of RatAB toxin-antitoxin module